MDKQTPKKSAASPERIRNRRKNYPQSSVILFSKICNLPENSSTSDTNTTSPSQKTAYQLEFYDYETENLFTKTEIGTIPTRYSSHLFSEGVQLPYSLKTSKVISVHLKQLGTDNHNSYYQSSQRYSKINYKFKLDELFASKSNHLSLKSTHSPITLEIFYETRSSSTLQQLISPTRTKFLEYVHSGVLKLNLIIGIDFTLSNGDPLDPCSLHHFSEEKVSDYQKVIADVASLLFEYNAEKAIPMYGFGGVPRFENLKSNKTSHFFPLSGDWQECAGLGIEGCFHLYKHALKHTGLRGPTFTAPLIEEVIEHVHEKKQENERSYTVLLVITDGIINDFEETLNMVVKGSELPISIIFCGVGESDFGQMEELGMGGREEQGPTDSWGMPLQRDNVQFVEYEKVKYRGSGLGVGEVLMESLPEQVVEWVDANLGGWKKLDQEGGDIG